MDGSNPTSASTVEPAIAPEPRRQESGVRRIIRKCFVGHGGIRAGWRLVVFIAIAVAMVVGLSYLARVFHQQRPAAATLEACTLLSNEIVAFLVILFASWVMSRIERRKIADYGLPLRGAFGSQFWQGVVMGFGAITVLLGVMRLAGAFRFGTIGLHGGEIFQYAALWAAAFLFVGLFEEFFFRGYPLFTLAAGITFWPSAILLSALFGVIHHNNPGESWAGALEAGITSLLFCLMLRRTGSLWMPIGFHAAWDWGQTYFYGVPDSGLAAKGHLFNPRFTGSVWLTGGSVGPEGSWLCVGLLVILWVIFALGLGKSKYPSPDAIRAPRESGPVAAKS